jgi:hypothetical protein
VRFASPRRRATDRPGSFIALDRMGPPATSRHRSSAITTVPGGAADASFSELLVAVPGRHGHSFSAPGWVAWRLPGRGPTLFPKRHRGGAFWTLPRLPLSRAGFLGAALRHRPSGKPLTRSGGRCPFFQDPPDGGSTGLVVPPLAASRQIATGGSHFRPAAFLLARPGLFSLSPF